MRKYIPAIIAGLMIGAIIAWGLNFIPHGWRFFGLAVAVFMAACWEAKVWKKTLTSHF